MTDFIFIIQARTGSTRLPNKMLMPFNEGLTIPQIIIRKLRANFFDIPVVLATTVNKLDDNLVACLELEDCEIYRGDEDNVVQRFVDVEKHLSAKAVIRICADNPFLDMHLLKELMTNWKSEYDYLAHQINGKPSMKTAYGFFAEITTFNSLKKVLLETSLPLYLEHVTNYVYQHEDLFNVKWIPVDHVFKSNENVRLTVDTINDFENASSVYKSLIEIKEHFIYKDVIETVKISNFMESMIKENNNNAK